MASSKPSVSRSHGYRPARLESGLRRTPLLFHRPRQPLNSPVDRLGFTGETDSKWLFRNDRVIDSGIRKIVGDAVLVEPLLFLTLFLIVQRDA